MLVDINGNHKISVVVNGEVVDVYKSLEWCIWMRNLKNYSKSTAQIFMKSVERFFLWGIHNPIKRDEAFPFYLARYRMALMDGFTIKEILPDDGEIVVCKSNRLARQTINKEMEGIKSYYRFIDENSLIESTKPNYKYERASGKYGMLSGIGIKKSSTYIETLGKKEEFLKAFKTTKAKQRDYSALPFELFDKLLAVSKPRERLIFLLCGACSARIGQALNLTLYDIDYDKQDVWLIDPKSDKKDIYSNNRARWLMEKYLISSNDPEHDKKDLQFKHPIPLKSGPLIWLVEDKYKKLFFKTLIEYTGARDYVPEAIRGKPHPFVFITKSGRRLSQNHVLIAFKSALRKIEPDVRSRLIVNFFNK
jgi:integrase